MQDDAMKILCLFCELWLVEPVQIGGEVTYYCARCSNYPPDGEHLVEFPLVNPASPYQTMARRLLRPLGRH